MKIFKKSLVLIYGVLAYTFFLSTFVYMILFTGGYFVPKTVDVGNESSIISGIILNLFLLTLFGIQHSTMARPEFKKWITRFIPKVIERSTFVLVSTLFLVLVLIQWSAIPVTLWKLEGTAGLVMEIIFVFGWILMVGSTFIINHFDLFGLKQVFFNFTDRVTGPYKFKMPLLYKIVRHPMMLGFFIGFWATPHMTLSHFIFAAGMTAYILIGVHYEEKDLIRQFGQKYIDYKKTTPAFFPEMKRSSKAAPQLNTNSK